MARITHSIAVAKLETTYGTDIVPVAGTAADMVLCQQMSVMPFEAEVADRPRVQPFHGNKGRPGSYNRAVKLALEVPMCGSGAAGTIPPWGKLHRMCGMAETITASTKVDYSSISAAQESGSFYYLMDGTRHRALGARGTFEINMAVGSEPTIKYDFTGLYSDPTGVALPTGVYSAWRDAIIPRASTLTCTINAVTYPMRSLRYTHGNSLLVRDLPMRNEVRITERAPSMEVLIEAPDGLVPANFFSAAASDSELPFFISLAGAAGDVVELAVPRGRLLPGLKYERDGDVAMLRIPVLPRPNTGNDEILITAR